jgi:hypothetical protein
MISERKAAARCRGDGSRRQRKATQETYHSFTDFATAIYNGTAHLGDVVERDDGLFEAQVGDDAIGPFPTRKAATDALLADRQRPRARS